MVLLGGRCGGTNRGEGVMSRLGMVRVKAETHNCLTRITRHGVLPDFHGYCKTQLPTRITDTESTWMFTDTTKQGRCCLIRENPAVIRVCSSV
jgi:hypothetical protein